MRNPLLRLLYQKCTRQATQWVNGEWLILERPCHSSRGRRIVKKSLIGFCCWMKILDLQFMAFASAWKEKKERTEWGRKKCKEWERTGWVHSIKLKISVSHWAETWLCFSDKCSGEKNKNRKLRKSKRMVLKFWYLFKYITPVNPHLCVLESTPSSFKDEACE